MISELGRVESTHLFVPVSAQLIVVHMYDSLRTLASGKVNAPLTLVRRL